MPSDPSLLFAHEERISDLEEKQSDLKSDINVLKQKVDDGFASVVDEIRGFKEALSQHALEDRVVASKVSEISLQMSLHDARRARWASFGKYAWALFLVIVGAAAKLIFDRLTK